VATPSFMPAIARTTSGRLHSEFVSLLFLQAHRETDRFFAASGVQLTQPTSAHFHFHRSVFSSQIRSKVGSTLVKDEALRVNLNLDGVPITSRTVKDEALRVNLNLDGVPITSRTHTVRVTHHTRKHFVY
jgi:hypothetical protein